MAQITDERLVKILSETQATIMEHNSRCVRGSVEVDARLFESMIMELQVRRKADSEPVGKPFMYGIADPDGNAYIDEFCVSDDLGLVEDTVNELNYDREEGYELNYSVVALYRHAQPAPVELANIALPHSWLDGEGVEVMSANEVKRACRAAMLNGGKS